MEIGYTPEQEAMRTELRGYYEKLLDDATVAELGTSHGIGAAPRRVWKQMCADGWAGIGWPKEYGGQGRSAIEQFIFFDESMRAGAPVPMLTVNSVAPTIMQFGSDEQKKFFLPKILKGEIHFAIGYTEPAAGTDLASLQTRAVRDGDFFVINGQKIWTSLATDADYIWLAVRTDPEAPKHKGISMLIVPREAPGVRVAPIKNMGLMNTNQTFYDDVRVPASNLVGKLNGGWRLITNQLNHERVTLCSSGMIEGRYEDLVRWAKATRLADGRRVVDQEWVQVNLARIWSRLEFVRLMNFKIAWGAEQGQPLNPAHASSIKVFGTEFYLEACRLMLEILGPVANLRPGSPEAVMNGSIAAFLRSIHVLTFGGGTNEMQRDLIALFGLSMPVQPRF